MLFAPSDKVDAMRALLLQHGAKESKEDQKRWQIRKDADLHELHATKTFYEDDRHLCPVLTGPSPLKDLRRGLS